MPLLFLKSSVPPGEFKLTMLDVGQGLAMVVQTHSHVVVYDTGSSFLSGGDMGRSVLIPFFHHQAINQIDKLIISHGDDDHIGGAHSIISSMKVDQVITSVPERFSHADYCLAGQHWQFDGVNFTILYPDKAHLHQGNNSSCVLRISDKHHSALLVGDNEAPAERYLVKHYGQGLSTELLQVGHHGSKTSSTQGFLSAVSPRIALFSYGFHNRFHFPHPSVASRYARDHIRPVDTVDCGAITWFEGKIACYRQSYKQLWS